MRDARRRAGLSLQELAARAGCAKSYLSAVETGQRSAPSDELLARLEAALGIDAGTLTALGQYERGMRAGGDALRGAMLQFQAQGRLADEIARVLREGGPEVVSRLRRLTGAPDEAPAREPALPGLPRTPGTPQPPGLGGGLVPVPLPMEVPLINKVAAGYPTEFTDLSYPSRVADEYLRVPDLSDPDAFAARVCGDSMRPEYQEGDVVVFSPGVPVRSGMDCFVRLEPDHASTFKRVFFEAGEGGETLVRLQPLNPQYPAQVYPREAVAGLYAAVSVVRRIGLAPNPNPGAPPSR